MKNCKYHGEHPNTSEYFYKLGACRKHALEYAKEYLIKNANRINKKGRAYNARPEVKEHRKEYQIKNADRIKKRTKEYRIKNAAHIKEHIRKYIARPEIKEYRASYNLKLMTEGAWQTVGEKHDAWIKQGKLCPICNKPIVDWRGAAADHLHGTNIKRGLLHNNCNALLGFANDNTSTLLNSIAYLNSYSTP